jgi:hypothetical protein
MDFLQKRGVSIFLFPLVLSVVTASFAANSNLLAMMEQTSDLTINSQMENAFTMNPIPVKEKVKSDSGPECEPGAGKIKKGSDIEDICNPGLENMKKKLTSADSDDNKKSKSDDDKKNKSDDDKKNKLADKIDKKEVKLKERLERLESILEEEEKGKPISNEKQKLNEKEDQKVSEEHESETDKECRDGNVLDGASNQEDLRVIQECEEAEGEVMHTKNMDDGDYKFLLRLDDKYEFLLNDGNEDDTDGFLVVEVVPKDRDSTLLPDTGDKVHIFGAWVTDEPKGWREIHPVWSVEKQ